MNRNYFTGRYAQAKFAVGMALFFAVAAAVSPMVVVYMMSSQREYIVQNAAGNYYVARGEQLEDAPQVWANCIRTAVLSLFNRTPHGAIDPVTQKQTFTRECIEIIKSHYAETQKTFETQNIRQLCEIASVDAVHIKDGKYRAVAKGILTQSCHFLGDSYVRRHAFRISLLCAENPDMRTNGMFPLVVYYVEKIEITPVEDSAPVINEGI